DLGPSAVRRTLRSGRARLGPRSRYADPRRPAARRQGLGGACAGQGCADRGDVAALRHRAAPRPADPRLRTIASHQPFQLVLAGKAHPQDRDGKALIKLIHNYARQLSGSIPIAFLPAYDMTLAKLLVSGADVWLNTPVP